MTPARFDAVVVGAGHNGLTCAAYLAGAGLSVCVVERRDVVGGAAVTEEFHPGFRNSTASYTVSLLAPEVIADLRLHAHGLAIVKRSLANFLPLPGNAFLKVGGGLAATQAEVAKFSPRDAQRLPDYYAMLSRVADVLRELLHVTPPNVGARRGGRFALALDAWKTAKPFRALDRAGQRDVLDLFTKSAGEILDRWFECEADQGGLRFRRGRRQFPESLRTGIRLCAPASRVRRSERRARPVGPRARRHGCDHAGDGEGMRRTRRHDPHGVRGATHRVSRTDAHPASTLDSGETIVARARRRQRESEAAVRAPRCTRARRRGLPRTDRRLPLRLRHVPDERRAVGIAGLHVRTGSRAHSRITAAASSWRRRSRTWSARISTRRSRAGRASRSSRC